jgi:hypothetical protein
MRWTPRYDVEAVRAIYTLPRGVAGEVTDAIRQLLVDPRPPKSEPVPGRDQTYQIHVQGHRVEYELIAEQQILKILFIE